jgi:hypothetical protein
VGEFEEDEDESMNRKTPVAYGGDLSPQNWIVFEWSFPR